MILIKAIRGREKVEVLAEEPDVVVSVLYRLGFRVVKSTPMSW